MRTVRLLLKSKGVRAVRRAGARTARRWRKLGSRPRRIVLVTATVLLFLAVRSSFASDAREPFTASRREILDAIRAVESGGREHPPDGDGGLAIGPYQIHEVYWRDAVTFEPAIGGSYQNCRERRYAERVIDAYMRRWVPDAWQRGDAEIVARTHNGGPEGAERDATLRYWDKVRARLTGTD